MNEDEMIARIRVLEQIVSNLLSEMADVRPAVLAKLQAGASAFGDQITFLAEEWQKRFEPAEALTGPDSAAREAQRISIFGERRP